MSTIGLIMLILGNLPVFIPLGHYLFGGWDEFRDCVELWLPPDLPRLFTGGREVLMGQMKLLTFCLICVSVVGIEVLATVWL